MNAQREFRELIATITAGVAGKPLDQALESELNRQWPAGSPVFRQLFEACRAGIEQGWMCRHESGGIRYGRVLKPADDLHGFSVDVVDMDRVVGPQHRHPKGEIDLVMPLTQQARFDGRGVGWRVYAPDSAHPPTVSDGRALVLYLLPDGAIDFG